MCSSVLSHQRASLSSFTPAVCGCGHQGATKPQRYETSTRPGALSSFSQKLTFIFLSDFVFLTLCSYKLIFVFLA